MKKYLKKNKYRFRAKRNDDKDWIKSVVSEQWGSTKISSRDRIYNALILPSFIAEQEGKSIGIIYI